MKNKSIKMRWLRFCGFVLAGMILTAWIVAQDDQIRQTVARVSYTSGDASLCRGDDPGNWQPLSSNVPMVQGDRVYTGDGSRLELQLEGGNLALLNDRTDLGALQLTDDFDQFSLDQGRPSFTSGT